MNTTQNVSHLKDLEEKKDKQIALELANRIKHSQSGEWNNVCIHCFGTGFKE